MQATGIRSAGVEKQLDCADVTGCTQTVTVMVTGRALDCADVTGCTQTVTVMVTGRALQTDSTVYWQLVTTDITTLRPKAVCNIQIYVKEVEGRSRNHCCSGKAISIT
jgi:hypothetical protein